MSTKGNVGKRIAERALQNDPDLGCAFVDRVAYGDCGEKWWNEKCETKDEMRSRIEQLWEQLLARSDPCCILVTHSNVIKQLSSLLCEHLESFCGTGGAGATLSVPEVLRHASSSKLQNAGVLGLRCIPSQHQSKAWVVDKASLMFNTSFEGAGHK